MMFLSPFLSLKKKKTQINKDKNIRHLGKRQQTVTTKIAEAENSDPEVEPQRCPTSGGGVGSHRKIHPNLEPGNQGLPKTRLNQNNCSKYPATRLLWQVVPRAQVQKGLKLKVEHKHRKNPPSSKPDPSPLVHKRKPQQQQNPNTTHLLTNSNFYINRLVKEEGYLLPRMNAMHLHLAINNKLQATHTHKKNNPLSRGKVINRIRLRDDPDIEIIYREIKITMIM